MKMASSFDFDEDLIIKIASRPRMKWQWILKMAQRGWLSEYVSDNAAMRKRKQKGK